MNNDYLDWLEETGRSNDMLEKSAYIFRAGRYDTDNVADAERKYLKVRAFVSANSRGNTRRVLKKLRKMYQKKGFPVDKWDKLPADPDDLSFLQRNFGASLD